MGKRGVDVEAWAGNGGAATEAKDSHGDRQPEEIEREIEVVRSELGDLVQEVERRKDQALEVPLQVGLHPAILVAGGIAFLLVLAAFTARSVRRRRTHGALERAQMLAHALAVIARHPERLVHAVGD